MYMHAYMHVCIHIRRFQVLPNQFSSIFGVVVVALWLGQSAHSRIHLQVHGSQSTCSPGVSHKLRPSPEARHPQTSTPGDTNCRFFNWQRAFLETHPRASFAQCSNAPVPQACRSASTPPPAMGLGCTK